MGVVGINPVVGKKKGGLSMGVFEKTSVTQGALLGIILFLYASIIAGVASLAAGNAGFASAIGLIFGLGALSVGVVLFKQMTAEDWKQLSSFDFSTIGILLLVMAGFSLGVSLTLSNLNALIPQFPALLQAGQLASLSLLGLGLSAFSIVALILAAWIERGANAVM